MSSAPPTDDDPVTSLETFDKQTDLAIAKLDGALGGVVARLMQRAGRQSDEIEQFWMHSQWVWAVYEEVDRAGEAARFVRSYSGGSSVLPRERAAVEAALLRAADRAEGYLLTEIPSTVILRVTAIFEYFLLDLTRAWLLAFPRSLLSGGSDRRQKERQVPLSEILAAANREDVIERVADKAVRDLAYSSLRDQFKYLESRFALTALDEKTTLRLSELKATRDALAHADGIVGHDYLSKSGNEARAEKGERLQLPDGYIESCCGLVRDAIVRLSEAAVKKAGDALARG